jgi:hypothetical protein
VNFSGRLVGWVLLLSCTAAVAATVPPELWDRPRSAAAVMAQNVIRQAVADHHARTGSRLVIVHGVGQEAQLQAEELRAWLVALAVDSARLMLRADPAVTGLRIEVSE